MKNANVAAKKLTALLRKLGPGKAPADLPDPSDSIAVLVMSFLLWESSTDKALAAYARMLGDLTGPAFVFFVLAVAAAEAAVGLALFIAIYRHAHTLDVNRINLMRW